MNVTDKISKYLTVGDAIKSETAIRRGIDNSMNEVQLGNAKHFATKVYDPIKDKFPNALSTSFFRCPKVNKLVGGSDASFHCYAGADDIDSFENKDNKAIFKWVLDGNVPFNELIWEYGTLERPEWVHVGLLPGYTTKNILHIYNIGKVKHRDVLTKDQAYKLFHL